MSSSGSGAPGDGRLADPESLRRIEWMAVAWTVTAVLGYGVVRSWTGAAILTGASAASIVAFRALQRIVSALGPAGTGSERPSEADPVPPEEPAGRARGPDAAAGAAEAAEPAGSVAWGGARASRPVLATVVRLSLLGAIAVAGSFLLEPEFFPAIVLGFSMLPAALMTEGLLQALRALRGRDHDDVC